MNERNQTEGAQKEVNVQKQNILMCEIFPPFVALKTKTAWKKAVLIFGKVNQPTQRSLLLFFLSCLAKHRIIRDDWDITAAHETKRPEISEKYYILSMPEIQSKRHRHKQQTSTHHQRSQSRTHSYRRTKTENKK